ncbi:hypothetical protein [Chryseobacterium sp. JK1]|uniref:hypothetical protein n=1 Tax=Chryseobacterium sp. JK1 TaxID=874294 RepID=UPI003D69D283
MQKINLILILVFFSLINCKKSNIYLNYNFDKLQDVSLNKNNEIDSLKMYGFDDSNKAYEIQGKNIFLREGPGQNYKKLINQKATDALGETNYMQVDYTCLVSIEEEKNNWAKVRVVDPSYLSTTHYGWIPLKNIVQNNDNEGQTSNVNLSPLQYEIISTTENNVSKNYYIYLNTNSLSKNEISAFIKQFREKHCSTCTISIFDTKLIKNLIEAYPLDKDEYLKFADHFVAWSTFDVPKSISFYPFQDLKYREYGGKNFKEQKMK